MGRILNRGLLRAVILAAMLAGPGSGAGPSSEPASHDDTDTMRPTRLGLRMTPALARGLARFYVADEVKTNIPITEDQQSRLNKAVARRMMRLAHENGKAGRDFIEGAFELLLETDGKFNSTTGQAFAERIQPVLPVGHEFLKGLVEDARPILAPDELRRLQAKLRRESKELERFENKMERWAAGGAKENEDLDRHYEPEDGPAPEPEENDPSRDKTQWARRSAERELKQLGPQQWARFVMGTKRFFELDDEQSARADQLLEDYRQRAETVMTAEWKKRVLRNRTQRRLHHDLGDVPTAPWRYHLDSEYERAVAPVKEMGRQLREAVFALATDEQRQAALARLRKSVEKHGMTVEASDARMLRLGRE